jgi:hypothetical protein
MEVLQANHVSSWRICLPINGRSYMHADAAAPERTNAAVRKWLSYRRRLCKLSIIHWRDPHSSFKSRGAHAQVGCPAHPSILTPRCDWAAACTATRCRSYLTKSMNPAHITPCTRVSPSMRLSHPACLGHLRDPNLWPVLLCSPPPSFPAGL